MNTVWTSIKTCDQTLNDVTRLCLAVTTGCFLVGGLFLLADSIFPLGPRGVALIMVGCFFLAHGLFELAKQFWHQSDQERGGNKNAGARVESAAPNRNEGDERTAA